MFNRWYIKMVTLIYTVTQRLPYSKTKIGRGTPWKRSHDLWAQVNKHKNRALDFNNHDFNS